MVLIKKLLEIVKVSSGTLSMASSNLIAKESSINFLDIRRKKSIMPTFISYNQI